MPNFFQLYPVVFLVAYCSMTMIPSRNHNAGATAANHHASTRFPWRSTTASTSSRRALVVVPSSPQNQKSLLLTASPQRRRQCRRRIWDLRGGGVGDGDDDKQMITIRIRMPDGGLKRLQVASTENVTLRQVLQRVGKKDDDDCTVTVVVGGGGGKSTTATDPSQTLHDLHVQHGTLLTLTSSSKDDGKKTKKKTSSSSSVSSLAKQNKRKDTFDPFPDLAKDYNSALLQAKAKRGSYSTLSKLQNSMHVVEPQPEGKVKRLYMCETAAARFQSNAIVSNEVDPRVGLLLGTVHRERVETKKKKQRTSLSSAPGDDAYCQVVKVQAIYEPPQQQQQQSKKKKKKTKKTTDDNASSYSAECLKEMHVQHRRVLELADALGLQVVGWIFAYNGKAEPDRHADDDALPVLGRDVTMGASLQIQVMKQQQQQGELPSPRFVTLAMDASTGATEAFQLSDVAVQMVAEGLFPDLDQDSYDDDDTTEKSRRRFVRTNHPVIVDGKETQELDSVLCLVNTALLSHAGWYGHGQKSPTKRKTGTLTTKTIKQLQRAAEGNDDSKLLGILSDFSVLLAVDQLQKDEKTMNELCKVIQKYARGQKKTTSLEAALKYRIHNVLKALI